MTSLSRTKTITSLVADAQKQVLGEAGQAASIERVLRDAAANPKVAGVWIFAACDEGEGGDGLVKETPGTVVTHTTLKQAGTTFATLVQSLGVAS